MSFSPSCFQSFFIIFHISIMMCDVSNVGFAGFIPISGFTQLLESVYMSFLNLGSLQPLLVQFFFCTSLFLLSFQDYSDINKRQTLFVSTQDSCVSFLPYQTIRWLRQRTAFYISFYFPKDQFSVYTESKIISKYLINNIDRALYPCVSSMQAKMAIFW